MTTPCPALCELCIKRGYNACANAAQTTPLPTPEQIDAAMLADKQSNGYDRRADAQAMRIQIAHQTKGQ